MFFIAASLSPFAEWPFMLQGKVGKLPEKVVVLNWRLLQAKARGSDEMQRQAELISSWTMSFVIRALIVTIQEVFIGTAGAASCRRAEVKAEIPLWASPFIRLTGLGDSGKFVSSDEDVSGSTMPRRHLELMKLQHFWKSISPT